MDIPEQLAGEPTKTKSLPGRLFDTIVVAGAGTITAALIGGAVALMWDKTSKFDENLNNALSGIKATQDVTAQELADLRVEIERLRAEIHPKEILPTATSPVPAAHSKDDLIKQYIDRQQQIQMRK